MHKYLSSFLLCLVCGACAPTVVQRDQLPTRTAAVESTNNPTAPVPSATTAAPTSSPSAAPALPTDTPRSTVTPSSTAPTSTTNSLAELAALDAAKRVPRDQVVLAMELGACRTKSICPAVARTTPLTVKKGDFEDFWVVNSLDDTNYTVAAELRYVGQVVLMYVQKDTPYDQQKLEAAARTFERSIYPLTRSIFGSEAKPGVDGDDRITILNGRSTGGGVLGYFSARDSVPKTVNRFSNEREMFYMNIEAMPFDRSYLDVLAHEFQHMTHRNEQGRTSTWFNEGNSMLSEDLNGYVSQGYVAAFLSNPDTQLTAWSVGANDTTEHYGAAQLFMRYIYAQYGQKEWLRTLIRANAGNDVEVFTHLAAKQRPDLQSFGDLFADWATANLINDPKVGDGRYTYDTGHPLGSLLPFTVQPAPVKGKSLSQVSEFAAAYYELPAGPSSTMFKGDLSVNVVGEKPQGTFSWWSGRSDNSVATLSHKLDLRHLKKATLRFSTWYEIENAYDYGFVSISLDGGKKWETLKGRFTTNDDPQGANYGNGYTGVSGAPGEKTDQGIRGTWLDEQMDLTPYVGKEVVLRFWQITDEGYNASGWLIDNIQVCDQQGKQCVLDDNVDHGVGEWVSEGFAPIDGDLPQRWSLRLVRTAADGTKTVDVVPIDSEGLALINLAAGEHGELMVAATTPHTTEHTHYDVWIP